MSTIRVKITIPHESAIPADAVTNTWHFFAIGEPDAADFAAIDARMTAFYSGAGNLTSMMSSRYQPENASMALYDLADPEPRVPIFETPDMNWTASPAGTTDLPAEVAVCLSFQADQVSGEPQARKRGRVYLGPWTVGDAISGDTGRPLLALRTKIANNADALKDSSTADLYWAVWSQADALSRRVTNGWVDDAFDIQRRRGLAPTVRTVFS